MTEEELKKVPFHFVAHMAMANEHTTIYTSEDNRLGFCDHVPVSKCGTFRKGYRHWRIDSKVYTSQKEFIEALKDFKP